MAKSPTARRAPTPWSKVTWIAPEIFDAFAVVVSTGQEALFPLQFKGIFDSIF